MQSSWDRKNISAAGGGGSWFWKMLFNRLANVAMHQWSLQHEGKQRCTGCPTLGQIPALLKPHSHIIHTAVLPEGPRHKPWAKGILNGSPSKCSPSSPPAWTSLHTQCLFDKRLHSSCFLSVLNLAPTNFIWQLPVLGLVLRIMEEFGMEGAFQGHLVQPPCNDSFLLLSNTSRPYLALQTSTHRPL